LKTGSDPLKNPNKSTSVDGIGRADASGQAQAPADGLAMPQRFWAVLTLFISLGICVLDASMVNVALPEIAASLNVPAAATVWVVNVYGLTVAGTLLPFAAMAERIGFKRAFRFGLILFVIGALVSALSASLEFLLVGRVVQGLGASAIMCLFGGLMRHIYPTRLLAKGIGLNAVVVSVNSVIGPSLGSVILTFGDWRWIFVSVIPLAVLAGLTMRALPIVARINRRFDYRSAVHSALTIGLFILGLDYLAKYPLFAIASIALSVGLAIALIRRSMQQTAPLVPVDLLRIDAIRAALAASLCSFSAQMAMFVALPFYLLVTLGRDAITVGLLMAAWPLGAAVMAVVSGRLADRYPVAVLCGIGSASMLVGTLWIVLAPESVNDAWLFVAMLLGGVGFGFFQTPNNRVLIGSSPRERAGAIGGLQAVTRVFGQTVGAALVAMVFTVSLTAGPTHGLIVSAIFSFMALMVNVRRYLKPINQ
jgi:MFS transporter, DHA2 family, multidrug resistance protein